MHKHPGSSKLIIVIRFSSAVMQVFVLFFVPLTYVINFSLWNSLWHALLHLQIIVWVSGHACTFQQRKYSPTKSLPPCVSFFLLQHRYAFCNLLCGLHQTKILRPVSGFLQETKQACPARVSWPVLGLSCYFLANGLTLMRGQVIILATATIMLMRVWGMLFLGRPTFCVKARRRQMMKKKVANVNKK